MFSKTLLFLNVGQLRAGKRAIRIRRVKEPLLLTLCTATTAAGEELESTTSNSNSDDRQLKGRANAKLELGSKMVLDPELYEGVVSQPIIEPTVSARVLVDVHMTLFYMFSVID